MMLLRSCSTLSLTKTVVRKQHRHCPCALTEVRVLVGGRQLCGFGPFFVGVDRDRGVEGPGDSPQLIADVGLENNTCKTSRNHNQWEAYLGKQHLQNIT